MVKYIEENSMKLARFGEVGIEKPATVDASGQLRDLSSCIPDISGKFLSDEGLASLRGVLSDKVAQASVLDCRPFSMRSVRNATR